VSTTSVSERGQQTVAANGIEIAYRDVGSGPPLVLLSGALASTGPRWAGSPAAHVDHLERLGEHFRVIAPDTRGAGATVHPGGAAGFDVLAADVIALIEVLGLERPAVAGFSEGGCTATHVALQRPDLLRAHVNHGGFDYFDPTAPAHQGLGPIFGGGPGATQADPDAAEQTFRSMGPPMSDVFATMQADYDEAQGEGHWRAYLGQFFDRSAAPAGVGVEDLAGIEVPTLVLVGDRDFFCSVELACAVYRTVPDAELAIVPGTEHAITAAVIDQIISFLTRQPG
jgi:pimeloyl-ACP methyl ester carboxylesterase